MLLIDLSLKRPSHRRRFVPLVVVAAGLFLFLGFGRSSFHLPVTPAAKHELGIEERESILMVLERLDNDFPRLRSVVSRFRSELAQTEVSVVDRAQAGQLVWKRNGSLLFSSHFFDTDSMSQESAIAHLIAPADLAVKPQAPSGDLSVEE